MSDDTEDRAEREPTHHQRTFSPEAPRITDELYEAFPQTPMGYSISPDDGLPTAQAPASVAMALAPLQTLDTFICQADTREFVLRDRWGEITARFIPAEVRRTPNGLYRVTTETAMARLNPERDFTVPAPERWFERLLRAPAKKQQHEGWVEVEPIRPACKHYARQLVDFPEDPDHRFIARLCTIRKTDSGEFLSLHATPVYGCELRDPRHESEQRIDQIDHAVQAVEQKPDEFNLDTALGAGPAQKSETDPSGGGIFSTTL